MIRTINEPLLSVTATTIGFLFFVLHITASSIPVTATLSEIAAVRAVRGNEFDDETGELSEAA